MAIESFSKAFVATNTTRGLASAPRKSIQSWAAAKLSREFFCDHLGRVVEEQLVDQGRQLITTPRYAAKTFEYVDAHVAPLRCDAQPRLIMRELDTWFLSGQHDGYAVEAEGLLSLRASITTTSSRPARPSSSRIFCTRVASFSLYTTITLIDFLVWLACS